MRRFLLAVYLVCLAVSAHGDEDCYSQVILKNKTGMKLKLTYVKLAWGKWDIGPPINIGKGEEVLYKATGRWASPSGTEGKLHYSLMKEDGTETQMVFVHEWDLPYDLGKKIARHSTYANEHGFSVKSEKRECKQTGTWPSECWGCQEIVTVNK